MYTGELFEPAGFEQSASMTGIAVDVVDLKNDWKTKVATIFEEASLSVPENCWMQSGGKSGRHSEQMGFILAEMQFLQRAYPGNEW
jgi:ring-1,2-phenylacetyl-CoA epoxidase subunit PaaC